MWILPNPRARRLRRVALLTAAVVVAVAAASRAAFPEVIDRLMAVVAGQTITLSDVEAARMLHLVPAPSAGDVVAGVLNRLIDRDLVLTEVDRYEPPEPAVEEVQKRLVEIEGQAGGEAAVKRALTDTGMTEDQLRRWARDDLRMRTYLNERFGTNDPSARGKLVADWIATLRRRSNVTILYIPS